MYLDWTILLMLPGLILGLYAQSRVKSAFDRYSKVPSSAGIKAHQTAQRILAAGGCQDVEITLVKGSLTDHYDPNTNKLALSESVYDSESVAAIGVAAHECGHAIQKKTGYAMLALRSLVVPAVNIGSYLSWPAVALGLAFSLKPLVTAGIVLFALVVLFALITLPVEFDASRRAMVMLREGAYLTQDELDGARKVLNAAALTYVASFISALMQLLRLILIAQRRRR